MVILAQKLELFVIMAWAVWGEICSRCHGENGTKGSLNIDWVVRYLETFHNSTRLCSKVVLVEILEPDRSWHAPTRNQFRVDVDAGFDVKRNAFSFGAIVRDDLGKLVGAVARVIRHPGTVISGGTSCKNGRTPFLPIKKHFFC